MNKTLSEIEKFHGHIGPYAIIGYKMGEIANRILGADPFSKNARVWTETHPPLSCVLDGIQMSSGCTLGKGNISVQSAEIPRALFINSQGSEVEIRLKPYVKQEIDSTVTEDNIVAFCEQFHRRSEEELFDID